MEDGAALEAALETALDAALVAETALDETSLATDETALEAAEAAEEATLLACRTLRTGLALTAPMAASATRDLPYMFELVVVDFW